MKSIILAATALALSSTMAFAERAEENVNGAGGQAVKLSTEYLRAEGTSLGQLFKEAKDEGVTFNWGEAVSGVNQDANHPEE